MNMYEGSNLIVFQKVSMTMSDHLEMMVEESLGLVEEGGIDIVF